MSTPHRVGRLAGLAFEKSDPTDGTRFGWTGELTAITLEGPPGRIWREAFE